MKSKTNAMATIAMTYAITSRVLEGDALQRVDDPHAAVDRFLQVVVDLLPADYVQRIGPALEQLFDSVVIERVSLLFDPLHLDRGGVHVLRSLDAIHPALNVLRGLDEQP